MCPARYQIVKDIELGHNGKELHEVAEDVRRLLVKTGQIYETEARILSLSQGGHIDKMSIYDMQHYGIIVDPKIRTIYATIERIANGYRISFFDGIPEAKIKDMLDSLIEVR